MIDTLGAIGIGTYYMAYYACYLVALAVVLLLLRVLRRRIRPGLRVAVLTVVGVLCIRLLLFDNPWALSRYQRALTSESLGQRQWGVLDLEIRKYQRDLHPPRLANLAVGSSQVGAIFYHWPSDSGQSMGVYSLAGMKTLDFVLNEDAIAAYNPARVVLYLSAFDMTGSPELFSLPLAPPRPVAMWSMVSRLRHCGLTPGETNPSLHAYIFSQLLPEYRYSFVFRAFLKQWFSERPDGGAAPAVAAPPPAPVKGRLTEFSTYFDPQWLDYNFLFFREFLAFCHARGIEVLIVEGQINPSARTPEIDVLNETVRSRFAALAGEFSNLRYVPASAVYEFTTEEYHDMTHVLPEAAGKYTARLSAYLAR
jgi:hypothetical protein